MSNFSNISEIIKKREPDALFMPPEYDDALVGYTSTNIPVYDIEKCIVINMEKYNNDRKSAEIDIGFLDHYRSEFTPVLIHLHQ